MTNKNSHSTEVTKPEEITIVGAGPAGLAAAITLAKQDVKVVVHEAKSNVGWRFGRDLQGLENWSCETDVLDEFKSLGMPSNFDYFAANSGLAFDGWDKSYPIETSRTLFYTVERGPGEGSFDSALLREAKALGVKVIFNSRINKVDGKAILASGPKQADAIAVGYQFKTSMPNGFWVICDDYLAPQGYAYLLVMNGRGNVKTCQFKDFKKQNLYVSRTVKAFERLAGLQMEDPVKHGGVGNFYLTKSVLSGQHPVAGEQAGFQDTLWGFGIRYAIRSGVMAANNLLYRTDYQHQWQQDILPLQKASMVNRWFYSKLGNRGYRWALKRGSHKDAHQLLFKLYQPSRLSDLSYPLINFLLGSKRKSRDLHDDDCSCIWCKR